MRRRDMRPYSLSGVLLSNQVSYFTKLLVVESVDATNGISINLRSYSLSGVLLSNQVSGSEQPSNQICSLLLPHMLY